MRHAGTASVPHDRPAARRGAAACRRTDPRTGRGPRRRLPRPDWRADRGRRWRPTAFLRQRVLPTREQLSCGGRPFSVAASGNHTCTTAVAEEPMMRLAIAGTVLLAVVSVGRADAQESRRAANRSAPATRRATPPDTPPEDALRERVIDIQQTLDRILAETTPAPVGTTGQAKTTTDVQAVSGVVTVDRARLLQLRRQLDALIGALNKP